MHQAIIIGTVRSLWTWLWGRYHVPQNVFLVIIIIIKSHYTNVRAIVLSYFPETILYVSIMSPLICL